MRRFFLQLGVLGLLLAGCAGPQVAAPQAGTPTLALEACRLNAAGLRQTISAECATLAVPEDYARPDGRLIELRIALMPAISRSAAADPLFLLAGGPGQAASEAFIAILATLGPVNQSRDIVLVDQRGTGSSNPLNCALDPDDQALAEAEPEDAVVREWYAACLAALDGDPRYYTTALAARDLDTVRAALGYEQVSLLGVSYGTRLAQTYLRLYPERVRALILDGVVPPEMAIGASMARDGQQALELIFAACAAEPGCAEAFPSPGEDFSALLADLEQTPQVVSLDDPFTGRPTEVRLNRVAAATTVFSMSYSSETAALLPLLIHAAYREGDLRPLAAQSLITSRESADLIALGMRNAVLCAEDVPFYPADPDRAEGYLGNLMPQIFAAACSVWPQGEADAAARELLRSDVPALLLSGERDPVTPPAYGEAVASGLPNSLHIVVQGQGHNVFFRGCLPTLVAEFLSAGSVAGLDTRCVERLGPTPFFTSFTGPRP